LVNEGKDLMLVATVFRYNCTSCGNTDFLWLDAHEARCAHCGTTYPISPTGVIVFDRQKTEQNVYFDGLYGAGHAQASDKYQEDTTNTFRTSMEYATGYLRLCGIDMTRPLEGLSILDAGSGSGWLTAGLLQNENITNSRFHAFDISANGLDMLAKFATTVKSSNRLELSVQNADKMRFGDGTFDVIIGSSLLHHLDAFEAFLQDCRRILKPDGVAVFGEPFALGYALGAAAVLLAQRELGTHYQEIEDFYADIAHRVKSPRKQLERLVDKHLFFQSVFLPMAQQIGFGSVEFVPAAPREYYRESFIRNELLHDRGIPDARLAERANAIYKIFYDIFDADTFVHSIAAFIYLVLRP
jgi:ubiquinone/menaquinone biosynthesis C-methylase UbiE